MSANENSFEVNTDTRPVYYVLMWRANEISDKTMNDFKARIPSLMNWLKMLRSEGFLVACGGGALESSEGLSSGLTIIKAKSFEHARELSNGTPMNEIGKTEVMIWDIFHANIKENENWGA